MAGRLGSRALFRILASSNGSFESALPPTVRRRVDHQGRSAARHSRGKVIEFFAELEAERLAAAEAEVDGRGEGDHRRRDGPQVSSASLQCLDCSRRAVPGGWRHGRPAPRARSD